jgi:hypothetical protein
MPDNKTITFKFQVYYRRAGTGTIVACDDTTIKTQALVTDPSAANIQIAYCKSTTGLCTGTTNVAYNFRCQNYDIANNWAQFANTVNLTLNYATLKTYDSVEFSLPTSGNWALFTAYKYYWSHINRVVVGNTPPYVIAFPMLKVKCGCTVVFKPLIIDDDSGDFVKCRKSLAANGESGGTTYTSTFLLNETTCSVTFPSTLKTSVAIELQLEDFNKNYMNGTVAKSSTSFQFNGVLSTCVALPNCNNVPKFTNSLDPSNSTIVLTYNTVFKDRVEAYSTGDTVTEIRIFKDFVGFNYNQAVLMYNASTGISYYDFNMTVTDLKVECESFIQIFQ